MLAADSEVVSEEDIEFMMKFMENKVELFFRFPNQKLLPEQIFRGELWSVGCLGSPENTSRALQGS